MNDEKKKMGLLVMAYGTPYKEEDIEPYYTHIRRGRPPAPGTIGRSSKPLCGNWWNFSACKNYGRPSECACAIV